MKTLFARRRPTGRYPTVVRCLVAGEVDCQSAAVVATGNKRSLQLISVAAAQERPRASLAGEARRGERQARGTGPLSPAADKRTTRIAGRPASGNHSRTQHTIIAERARERTRGEKPRGRCDFGSRRALRAIGRADDASASIGGEEVWRARPAFDSDPARIN